MKFGLIKKSFICALSISCFTMITACSNSTTKVFANKDIQAYAKKYDINYDNVKDITLYEYKESEKTSKGDSFTYTLLQDKTSKKYQLYMKYANRIYDVPTDEDETVTNVKSTTDLYNSYGYFIISFSTGKKMAIDYKGQTIVEKD